MCRTATPRHAVRRSPFTLSQFCVPQFAGAPLYGALPPCGIGELTAVPAVPNLDGLWHHCDSDNQELLRSLREDANAAALQQIAEEDFRLGRMTQPVPVAEADLTKVRIVPRFAVLQGEKPDGTAKVRAVDHMSWSASGPTRRKRSRKEVKQASINGMCTVPERFAHDHLDDLASATHAFYRTCGARPALWNADIDAAFRRVPLAREHISAAGVAWTFMNDIWISCHLAMPFGAASSVRAWHRVGALICSIARAILHLPIYRYVDDFFAVERFGHVIVPLGHLIAPPAHLIAAPGPCLLRPLSC